MSHIDEPKLMAWLTDAARIAEQALNGLDAHEAAIAAAGIETGADVELRVRMGIGKLPQITLLMIGPGGDLELRRVGGGNAGEVH